MKMDRQKQSIKTQVSRNIVYIYIYILFIEYSMVSISIGGSECVAHV